MSKMIIVKEYINSKDVHVIRNLQNVCTEAEGITLKLELDYKLAINENSKKSSEEINDFLYYMDENLIGYLGICSFNDSEMEVTGMVHPDYRGQGIFTELFQELYREIDKRKPHKVLLLNDTISKIGKSFIEKHKGRYSFSEYEMYLDIEVYQSRKINRGLLDLRNADNEDAEAIRAQNAIYMGRPIENVAIALPEDDKTGFVIYMAEVEGKIVGKVNIHVQDHEAGIYGLGILPEYRGKGFGRDVLLRAVEKALEMGVDKVMLQVEVKNVRALSLYESVGFKTTSTMDYYEFQLD